MSQPLPAIANIKLPFISVIMPVYNSRESIGRAIEALLSLDYPRDRYELIVVDNNSNDGTGEIVRGYPVRYLFCDEKQNADYARNKGARIAKGPLLAFCDADQVAHPKWLRKLLEQLTPELAGVAGPQKVMPGSHASVVEHYAAVDANVAPDLPAGPQNDNHRTMCSTGNVLYRREVYDRLGGFREDGGWVGDRDFASRLINELGMNIAYAPDAIQFHRPRASAMKLLRHEARFGHTAAYLRAVNKRLDVPSNSQFLMEYSRDLLFGAGALLRTVLLFWRYDRPVHNLGLISFYNLMRTAHLLGRMGFVLGWSPPRHW